MAPGKLNVNIEYEFGGLSKGRGHRYTIAVLAAYGAASVLYTAYHLFRRSAAQRTAEADLIYENAKVYRECTRYGGDPAGCDEYLDILRKMLPRRF